LKRLLIIIALLSFLLPASIAYAYTPPGQSSDNASDVILWYGDNQTANLTIESANLTLLADNFTVSGNLTITGLTESNESIASDYLAFLIVAFLIVIVLVKGGVILHALGVPVAFVYGFITASENTVSSPLWVAGVAIGILGLYFLYMVGANVVGRRK